MQAAPLLSLAAGIFQGVSQQSAYNYQAQVASTNAAIFKAQQGTALEEGQSAESNQRLKTGLTIGAAKAAQGANGIDVGSGSAVDVRNALAAEGEVDALTIRYNAARQAYGYGVEAFNQKTQSNLDKYAGNLALAGGIMQGFNSFLSQSNSIDEAGGTSMLSAAMGAF